MSSASMSSEMLSAYGMDEKFQIPQLYCGCGQQNSFDHILVCKKGGFVSMRHNILRDTEARMMEKVFKDVQVEPELPQAGLQTSGNNGEMARLDVTARGV